MLGEKAKRIKRKKNRKPREERRGKERNGRLEMESKGMNQ